MEFKIGDEVTYKDTKLQGHYLVVSEDENEFWLRSADNDNVFLRYPSSTMTKVESWRKSTSC